MKVLLWTRDNFLNTLPATRDPRPATRDNKTLSIFTSPGKCFPKQKKKKRSFFALGAATLEFFLSLPQHVND